jgi:hypothetical protein
VLPAGEDRQPPTSILAHHRGAERTGWPTSVVGGRGKEPGMSAHPDLAGDGFFSLVDLLDEAKAGFPPQVPAPLDARFHELAEAYRKADPALRQQVRDQIPSEYWAPLLGFCDRCAEWAMADKDPVHIQDGLTAFCLEDFRVDAHENEVHLSMLWYATKALHADTVSMFNEIGRFGSQHGLQELSNFSARPDDAKSPRSMGLETYQEQGHTRFRPRRAKAPPK